MHLCIFCLAVARAMAESFTLQRRAANHICLGLRSDDAWNILPQFPHPLEARGLFLWTLLCLSKYVLAHSNHRQAHMARSASWWFHLHQPCQYWGKIDRRDGLACRSATIRLLNVFLHLRQHQHHTAAWCYVHADIALLLMRKGQIDRMNRRVVKVMGKIRRKAGIPRTWVQTLNPQGKSIMRLLRSLQRNETLNCLESSTGLRRNHPNHLSRDWMRKSWWREVWV